MQLYGTTKMEEIETTMPCVNSETILLSESVDVNHGMTLPSFQVLENEDPI